MTIGVSKELTKAGFAEEVVEGDYLQPVDAESYVQPLSDGFSIAGSKETKERAILTEGFIQARPRVGKKSVEWTCNVEAKGSGVEGGKPDWHLLLKNMLGGNRELSARVVSGTGHSTSIISIEDADIGKVQKGDIVVLLEAGAHHISAVSDQDDTLGAASITLLVPAPSVPSDNVEIAKFQTYFGSNDQDDYKTLSYSIFHGDDVVEWASGCRPAGFTMSNFTTGEIASFDFSGGGVDFDRLDGSAPHTPNFDDSVPPLVLSACIFVDGEQLPVNNVGLNIEHTNGELPSTCKESGVLATRKTGKRVVTGSIDPYMDDTDVSLFEKFKNNTGFSVFGYAYNPSTVDGEIELGSLFAFYLPQCVSTSDVVADLDGINITNIEFTADGGDSGSEKEIYLGLV